MASLLGSTARAGLRTAATAAAPRSAGFAGIAGVRYVSKVSLPDLKCRSIGLN